MSPASRSPLRLMARRRTLRRSSIMTLGAKHGDVVTLSTEDDGAGEVLDSLVALLSRDLDQE